MKMAGSESQTNGDNSEATSKNELLFLGTFFHESEETHVDLIQFKEPVRVSEIRVIPLGATVTLSNDSFQLGATNPSKLDLEFFYSDLTQPNSSAFGLIQRFRFDDKNNIRLVCDDKTIITDGVVVRGFYSAITLGCYGVHVDHVETIAEAQVKEEISDVLDRESEDSYSKSMQPDTPVKREVSERIQVDNSRSLDNSLDRSGSSVPVLPMQSSPVILKSEDAYSSDHVAMDTHDLSRDAMEPMSVSASIEMETEEISDGEISSDEEKPDTLAGQTYTRTFDNGNVSPVVASSKRSPSPLDRNESEPKTSLETISQRDQLSDAEGSGEEFPDNGFDMEEISDDEMTDFGDIDMSEWQEYLAGKTCRIFDPFADSFSISSLQNFSAEKLIYERMVHPVIPAVATTERVYAAARAFSPSAFPNASIQTWVETLETFGHGVCRAVRDTMYESRWNDLIETLLYWANQGTDFQLSCAHEKLAMKVRHIKVGIRLVQDLVLCGAKVAERLLKYPMGEAGEEEFIMERLLKLFSQQYIGVSTKLLVLRTIQNLLSYKLGYRQFTADSRQASKTCVQKFVEYTALNQEASLNVRLTFSLRSVMNKLNLMEALATLDELIAVLVTQRVGFSDQEFLDKFISALGTIQQMTSTADQALANPARMLPVGAIMEFPPDLFGFDPKSSVIKSLDSMGFLRICALLLCWKDVPLDVVSIISDIVANLSSWEVGLLHMADESTTTLPLIRSLLLWEEEGNGNVAGYVAHCLEVYRCIDVVVELNKGHIFDDEEDIRALQALLSMLQTSAGRKAVLDVLSLGDNHTCLSRCIVPADDDYGYTGMHRLDRSVRKTYAIEILQQLIRYSDSTKFLQAHGLSLHKLITSITDDGDGTEVLLPLLPQLSLAVTASNFTYAGLENVCESIKASIPALFKSCRPDENFGFVPSLVTAVKVLAGLAIPGFPNLLCSFYNDSDAKLRVKELKNEMTVVKIHTLEMLPCFLRILQRVLQEYPHPVVNAYALTCMKGESLLSLVHPTIKLIRKLVTFAVNARLTDFRDVTAIPVLLQTYALMTSVPPTCLSHWKINDINVDILSTLLAYTIPTLKIGEESEEELNKTPWTALIKEILKFTLASPQNFLPGVTILSELLPLPLPLGARKPLSEQQCESGMKLRRLWSAYLYGLSPELQEVLGTLCGSTHSKLLNVLKKVCLQLADLSPSSCLVVIRAILDAVVASIENDFEQQTVEENANPTSSVKAWVETAHGRPLTQCSAYSSRLLGFLSSLISNAAVIKSGFMQAIRAHSKVDEKYIEFLPLLCSVIASKPTSASSVYHVQAQDHIVTIFQSLCDIQNNLLVPMYGRLERIVEPDVILANSLPPKDCLNLICSALMGYLSTLEGRITINGHVVEGVIRTFSILSETEYGFYHLRDVMKKYPRSLYNLCYVISQSEMENYDVGETLWPCVHYFLDYLKSMITPKTEGTQYLPLRSATLGPTEFLQCIGWESSDAAAKTEPESPPVEAKPTSENAEFLAESKPVVSQSDAEVISDSSSQAETKENILAEAVHPLVQLKTTLEKYVENSDGVDNTSSILASNYDPSDLIQMCDDVVKHAQACRGEISQSPQKQSSVEITLPNPEQLNDLYAIRAMYTLLDQISLEAVPSFWLTSIPPSFDLDVETPEADLVPCDLLGLAQAGVADLDLVSTVESLLQTGSKSAESSVSSPTPKSGSITPSKRNMLFGGPQRKIGMNAIMRGNQTRASFGRSFLAPGRTGYDPFRSRPPNTSRPPSLHVDDFVALESSGHGSSNSSAYSKGGMRPSDSFQSRMRGSPRGMPSSRPARQFRTVPSSGFYSNQLNRNDSPTPRGRYGLSRGRGFSDRWPDRSGGSGYKSVSPRSNYDDKFRSTGSGARNPSGSISRSPYPRPSYRNPSNNAPMPRWKDKGHVFQR